MSSRHFVFIVNSDDTLRLQLKEYICQEESLEVFSVATCEEVRQIFADGEQRVDLLLMADTLSDGDGIEFCQELRLIGVKIPIVMMTDSYDEEHIVKGLDSGANDYVIKPFHFKELLARLRAQLRAFDTSENVVFDIGPYIFRPSFKQLIDPNKGYRIHLTEKETAILKYLSRAGHQPVSRQILLDKVWGYNATVTTHTLETHIYRLRQKIEPDATRTSLLMTEGGGYRLKMD
ncbi:response regulator [Saccharibacter sp. 17.LH.SD]|uniref:response regulator transcription factor n=1 Tax=Saccharibacter sp. 17.LH.SD TaxID=2689393 RepID=UPI00136E4CD5|nr:response regulator transcription factor [Saccharibacter sp. 17.LH.SD]MXV44234.1 response regulator [Saccharibacter sp. 17.LH.SD]